jgi:DNA-binding GntR family transcriptional regulator
MENLSKLEHTGTLQNQAYYRIKTMLISGQLDFDQIYFASQFTEISGVSRTPIREALLQLTAEGFFVSLRGRSFKNELSPQLAAGHHVGSALLRR